MKTSDRGIDLITTFEGFSADAYPDVAGKMTIGYGHLIKPYESFPVAITEAAARDILNEDLGWAESAVSQCVNVNLNQNEFDALVCFTFNVGGGNLLKSTLLLKLNNGDYKGAADQFLRWCRAGGVEVAGLTRRRAAERALFLL